MQTYFKTEGHAHKLSRVLMIGAILFVLIFTIFLFAAYGLVDAMKPGDTVMVGGALQILQVTKLASEGGFVLEFALKPGFIGLLVCSLAGAYAIGAIADLVRRRG